MAEQKTEQKLISLKINERDVQVPPGTLLIEATRRIGTEVPSFCYYPGLSLQAACRMCLVEIEKMPKLQTACTMVATEGMVVRTDTPQVRDARKYMLEFLLTNHPLDCPVCDKGGECELQDMVFRYGADTSRFVEETFLRASASGIGGASLMASQASFTAAANAFIFRLLPDFGHGLPGSRQGG